MCHYSRSRWSVEGRDKLGRYRSTAESHKRVGFGITASELRPGITQGNPQTVAEVGLDIREANQLVRWQMRDVRHTNPHHDRMMRCSGPTANDGRAGDEAAINMPEARRPGRVQRVRCNAEGFKRN